MEGKEGGGDRDCRCSFKRMFVVGVTGILGRSLRLAPALVGYLKWSTLTVLTSLGGGGVEAANKQLAPSRRKARAATEPDYGKLPNIHIHIQKSFFLNSYIGIKMQMTSKTNNQFFVVHKSISGEISIQNR